MKGVIMTGEHDGPDPKELGVEDGSKKAVELSKRELEIIAKPLEFSGATPEERTRLMAEKGISENSGLVEVVIDGVPEKMNTDENDFGTLLDYPYPDGSPEQKAREMAQTDSLGDSEAVE